jgi:cob(I)alamin adenosyltransferase
VGKRLTKIYTRTGDSGTTGLADGSRLAKCAPRITAIGSVDELNSVVGLLLCEDLPQAARLCLIDVQHDLFDLGGELSVPGHPVMSSAHARRIEEAIDSENSKLAALDNFILPGGSRAASLAHLARTICRRAERDAVHLAQKEPLPAPILEYLNRLSDLLFVLAREFNAHAGVADVYWQIGKNRS